MNDTVKSDLPSVYDRLAALPEEVQAVFSKALNGTAESIRPAGCLLLARLGKHAWNAWRVAFPVRGSTNVGYQNHADFSDVDFRGNEIDFSGFMFGDGANFSSSKFGPCAQFDNAQWGDHANFAGASWEYDAHFSGACWGKSSVFKGANWGDGAIFESAQWGDRANFDDAQWGKEANFINARWGNGCGFIRAQWGSKAFLDKAQWGKEANFQHATWSEEACFRQAKWDLEADFCGACWGDKADFDGARWAEGAKFQGARWGDGAIFNGATWRINARFDVARWGSEAIFTNATWGQNAKFEGAQWGLKANFTNAKWGGGTDFSGAQWMNGAIFQGAAWEGDVIFSGMNWSALSKKYSSEEEYKDARQWADDRGLSPDALRSISFVGAHFVGEADFSNRKFTGKTDFGCLSLSEYENSSCWRQFCRWITPNVSEARRHVLFAKAPKFYCSELHQDTTFDGAKFPRASGSDEAARAYRTLKLAFNKQQALREEQRFFKLEMQEEAKRAGYARLLYWAYGFLGDYGFSLRRPLLSFGVTLVIFAFWYGYYDLRPICWAPEASFAVQLSWLEFSFKQPLMLTGLVKLTSTGGLNLSVPLWLLALHNIISGACLFLVGLALRNLFRLK